MTTDSPNPADLTPEVDAPSPEPAHDYDGANAPDMEMEYDAEPVSAEDGGEELPSSEGSPSAERAPSSASTPSSEAAPAGERLQKLLARAGVASRRAAEEIIREGRVSVNGHVITELGTRADLMRDRVVFDGRPLTLPSSPPVVVLLHKPKGYMTTTKDPEGRATVLDLIERDVLRKHPRLHPIGRLDFDTSGVLLLTDDGELTQFLTHPSHGVAKVYQARVSGTVKLETVRLLEAGIKLEDGMTAPCRVRVRAQTLNNALVEITLHEGRNRQVRRMLQAVGHSVSSLRRISLGGVDVKGMATAESRILLPGEVSALRKRAEEGEKPRKPRSSPPVKKAVTTKGAPKAAGGRDVPAGGRKPFNPRHDTDARGSRGERPKTSLSAGRFATEEARDDATPRWREAQAASARRESISRRDGNSRLNGDARRDSGLRQGDGPRQGDSTRQADGARRDSSPRWDGGVRRDGSPRYEKGAPATQSSPRMGARAQNTGAKPQGARAQDSSRPSGERGQSKARTQGRPAGGAANAQPKTPSRAPRSVSASGPGRKTGGANKGHRLAQRVERLWDES